MAVFNIEDYCSENNLIFVQVKEWLELYLRKTIEDIIDIPDEQIIVLKKIIADAVNDNYSLNTIPDKSKALKFLEFKIRKVEKRIQVLTSLMSDLSKERDKSFEINEKIEVLNTKIFELMKSGKAAHQIEINQLNLKKSLLLLEQYKSQTKVEGILGASIELEKVNSSLEKLKKLNSQLVNRLEFENKQEGNFLIQAKSTKNDLVSNQNSINSKAKLQIEGVGTKASKSKTMLVPWEYVRFGEKYIYFSRIESASKKKPIKRGHYFNGFPMQKSRLSFNEVKDLYINKNIPPIEIVYDKNNVLKIINIQVIFYFFLFLENTRNDFSIKNLPNIIREYSHFTKSFYVKHLPYLFSPRCFDYLINKISDNLPIIPIPEKVVHSSGSELIHDSFLFPYKKNNSYLWIWESVEESKATYIFETSIDNYKNEIQRIYDFLTSDFKNKRLSLVQNRIEQSVVPIVKRVKHSDFNEWKSQIDYVTKIDHL